jgi:hypothetical protein
MMKVETWLPLLALILGWGLSQITEVWKDRRASDRERLARQAELQRTTLLDLQDALLEPTRCDRRSAGHRAGPSPGTRSRFGRCRGAIVELAHGYPATDDNPDAAGTGRAAR